MIENKSFLFYMEELPDYKVADEYNDVRKWSVKDLNDNLIGVVDDLLVNKITEKVVYLDVKVDPQLNDIASDQLEIPENKEIHEYRNNEGENHIMIPIGMVNLDASEDIVYTNQVFTRTLGSIAHLKKGSPIDRAYEKSLLDNYRPADMVDDSENHEAFYERDEFKNNLHRKP